MRVAIGCVVASCVLGSTARADGDEGPRLGGMLGAGVAFYQDRWEYGNAGFAPAAELEVLARVWSHISVGVHADVTTSSGRIVEAIDRVDEPYHLVAFDVAVTARFVVHDRFWVGPWLGKHASREHSFGRVDWTIDNTSLGLTAGFDLTEGADRLSVFLELTDEPYDAHHDVGFSSEVLGIAYRR